MRAATGPRNDPAQMRILRQAVPSHRIWQSHVDAGPGHRLYLAEPRGAAPARGWPVLYLLDGNAAFDTLTPDLLAMVPGLALAGIGYDTDLRFDVDQRSLDLTPNPGDEISPDARRPGRMTGGAALFLERLTGPLMTAVQDQISADPARRVLWGHSYGGLFTLYAMLRRPQSFAGYAAISPSIWWNPDLMHALARQAGQIAPAPSLMVALGDSEGRSPNGSPAAAGPSAATLAFAENLRQQTGASLRVHVLKGMTHPQTIAASLPLALPFAERIGQRR